MASSQVNLLWLRTVELWISQWSVTNFGVVIGVDVMKIKEKNKTKKIANTFNQAGDS